MSIQTIVVRNSHNSTIQRAGTFFRPGVNKPRSVQKSRMPEISACRYLTVVEVEAAAETDGQDGDVPARPPEAGKGSGIDAWRTYATVVHGLEVDADATRDDIIAAVVEVEAAAETDGQDGDGS